SARVNELTALHERTRQFSSWYDPSLTGLSILRQLTLAFPEDNAVSAKTVEIRDLNRVTCTGTARNLQSLLQMKDQLGRSKSVSEINVDQIRGRSPVQFSLVFHWIGGPDEY